MPSPSQQRQRSSGPNRSLPVSGQGLTPSVLSGPALTAEVQRLVARGFSQARLVRLVLARRRLRTSAVVSELFAEFRHRCSAALGTDVVRADPHHPQASVVLNPVNKHPSLAEKCKQQTIHRALLRP